MTALLFRYVGLGILSILLALPLLFEKIKPNAWYGFRIRATLEDRKVWYAVNKYFAIRLFWAGVVEVFAALALFIVPGISADVYTLCTLAIFALAFTIGMMQSFRYLRSLQQNDGGSARASNPKGG